MPLLTYRPRPPLSEAVDVLWLHEGTAPAHSKERALPTGTVELVFHLGEEEAREYERRDPSDSRGARGPVVCGAHSEFFVIDAPAQAAIMGVHFKPGGAFPFLDLPVGELHNRHVPLDSLWGRRAGALRDRLLESRTPAERFRALEESLLATASRSLVPHGAVAFALQAFESGQVRTVGEATDRIGLSPRRFIELFTEQVGLTPKLYWRVRRFQEALRLIDGRRSIDWANVALRCGYYDQAHFLRDFRAFSGLKPTVYLEKRGRHMNHVPLSG